MTAQTWRTLNQEKNQLSLRLFLFLNTFTALFTLISPLYPSRPVTFPLLLLLAGCLSLLIWQRARWHNKINKHVISFLLGSAWAWHIATKNTYIPSSDKVYLLIALLSVLFIGALSFINNISAFICYCLPVVVTVIWLEKGEHLLRTLYAVTLPLLGIAMQYLIQKRNDNLAQKLMLKLLEEKETLTDLSMLDPLTGLYNRRGFQIKLESVLALETEQHFVMLLDIDHFKAYNDHYGHMMGDQVLIRVSAAVRDAVRSRDIVTRYGGEEFMVLLSRSDAASARLAAERIRQRVSELAIPHMFNDKVATHVTVSIGIACLPDRNIESALRHADSALYEAKKRGRNHVEFATERHAA